MLSSSKARGIQVSLLWLPVLLMYQNFLDQERLARWRKLLDQAAREGGARVHDFTHDRRFDESDFTAMPDHLNRKGAQKLTAILDREVH